MLLLMYVIDTDGKVLHEAYRKLSDYHLIHGSTITVCMRLKGGSLRPIPGLISVTYDEPDMITLVNS